MLSPRISLILVLTGFLLQACAVGNKQDVASARPDWQGNTEKSIAVASLDQRPYVLDGEKDPDFVGLQRGGFGNPFDVTTASRRPLSEDFSTAIKTALAEEAGNVSIVNTPASADAGPARSALLATGADRQILLLIKEWKADTYTNTALHYHLLLSVLGADGALLASQEKNGEDDLGGSFMNPPAHAKTAVPAAFKRLIEALLNDETILAALK